MSREPKAIEIRKQLLKFSLSSNSLTINELRIVLAIERVVARLENLKSSWGSVQLSEADATFESFWELLLTQFKKLDRILA